MLHTTPKASHYQAQLNAALVAGKWTAEKPAKDYKGSPIHWSDLVRKARKHCDVNGKELADVAEQTRALVLLLVKSLSKSGNNLDGDRIDAKHPLAAGEQHLLLDEDHQQAKKNLEKLSTERISQRYALARAYYYYSFGDTNHSLEVMSKIDLETFEDENVLAHSQSDGSTTSDSLTRGSIHSIHPHVRNGSTWATTELIRSFCIKGLCLEKRSPMNHDEALASYSKAASRIATIQFTKPSTPAPTHHIWQSHPPPSPSNDIFTSFRELHRWTQLTLFRGVVLSSRARSPMDTLQFARQHRHQSIIGHWPVTFRARHRIIVLDLHLRALIRISLQRKEGEGLSERMNEAKVLANDCKMLLEATTRFPRAGEVNEQVEGFVCLLFAFWSTNGFRPEYADWIIELLWWAATLTFNSPRIYRYLTHLFSSQSTPHSHMLAKRTLKVYVEVVGKARASGNTTNPESDETWIRMLIDGARILSRKAVEDEDGVEDLKTALTYLASARSDLKESVENSENLEARIDLAEGIALSVLAIKEENVAARQDRFAESLKCIERSLSISASASAHYHMSLALSRATPSQSISRAIEHAKLAIEGQSTEARSWHLLGLLLMASGEWAKAMKIVEEGIKVSEQVFIRGTESEEEGQTVGHTQDVQARDFAIMAGRIQEQSDKSILEDSRDHLPPAGTLIASIPDPPPLSRREEFEVALQLRLTYLAIIEHVHGSDRASTSWLELFSWFRDRKGWASDDGSSATSQGEDTQDTQGEPVAPVTPPEPVEREHHPHKLHKPHPLKNNDDDNQDLLIPPTAIKITPPTPLDGKTTENLPTEILTRTRSLSIDSLQQSDHSSDEHAVDEKGDSRPSPRRQGSKDSGHKAKKVQTLLKTQVHKGAEGFKTVSRRISKGGVGKRHDGISIHQSASAPDFHAILEATRPYQASSIHSRSRMSSWNIHRSTAQEQIRARAASSTGTAPKTASILQSTPPGTSESAESLSPWERKTLSILWVRAAATFRRGNDLEECKNAVQEAEILDENNVGVWVQYGLYLASISDNAQAREVFNKALFVDPEDVSASVHLSNLLLSSPTSGPNSEVSNTKVTPSADDIQMAVGLLMNATQYKGWDVAEAWYLLGKARRLQGSSRGERDCLKRALELSRVRGIRAIREAVGDCL